MHLLHAKRWRQPECLLVGEEINKKLHTHVMEYYLALKRIEILSHATTWVNLKETMLSVTTRCKKTNAVCFTYLGASEEVTFVETERRIVAPGGGGKGATGSYCLGGWSSRFAK